MSVSPYRAVVSKFCVVSGSKPSKTSEHILEMKLSAASGVFACAGVPTGFGTGASADPFTVVWGINLMCVPLAVTLPVFLFLISTSANARVLPAFTTLASISQSWWPGVGLR